MSEIKSFSDYTSKYNSNVDYSALFGGTSDSSSVGNTNMLSDYAAIKNGSYGKLMKAYYAKQDAEKLSGKGDTSQKLTLMKTSADSLKKSADALNDASLWEKKKIKKKDEKTGEETEVEDYDWDAIAKKVKSFIDDYNDVVKEAGESNTKDVLRNASWMTGMTDKTSHLLSKIGITIGKGNKLELDEDELKKADISSLKTVFTGYNSFAGKTAQKAAGISNAANRASVTYTNNGTYSKKRCRPCRTAGRHLKENRSHGCRWNPTSSDQSGNPGDFRKPDRSRRMLKPSGKIRYSNPSELRKGKSTGPRHAAV